MSIFFNNSSINNWFYASDNIIKVYKNNAVCYNKINTSSPTPPTPTYEWVSYSEGDTVPSSTIYGVKLGDIGLLDAVSIEFGTGYDGGFGFIWEDGDWAALDFETQEYIDITSYYDDTTYTYTILFSDIGYGGLPIMYPIPIDSEFEFNIDLYEEI